MQKIPALWQVDMGFKGNECYDLVTLSLFLQAKKIRQTLKR